MNKVQRQLLIIFLACAAPFIASYLLYYYYQPQGGSLNYGELLPTKALPALKANTLDGKPTDSDAQKGKWRVVTQIKGPCAEACEKTLYALRQSHTMTGKERGRVERLVLVDAAPSSDVQARYPGVVWLAPPHTLASDWPELSKSIVLLDPLGNQVLKWPQDPDIKRLHKDLARLLKASRIG